MDVAKHLSHRARGCHDIILVQEADLGRKGSQLPLAISSQSRLLLRAMEAGSPSSPRPVDSHGRLPGAFPSLALLLAVNMFNYLDRYILAAVMPNLQAEFFASNDPNAMGTLGLLSTAFLVSYMVAAPFFGRLGDRMSRWWLIAIALGGWSLASGASGLATTFLMMLTTRIFVGIGEGGYGPTAPTLISDYFPIIERGQMMSYFYMAIPVGSALGYAFGGMISER